MNAKQEKIDQLVKSLQLKPHPEGGYFRETYRSSGEIDQNCLEAKYTGKRNHSTCIYYLLTSDMFSAFHRLKQDEIWHFYEGSPVRIHMIDQNGIYTQALVGRDFKQGQVPQFVVPGGFWFAAEVSEEDQYSLVGCTVAPGFDFQDFKLAERKKLIVLFPQHKFVIENFTRS